MTYRRSIPIVFNGADEFTFFIVGNIGKDTVMPMVEKYIGSLPVAGRKETWIDRKVEQPKGKITRGNQFTAYYSKVYCIHFFCRGDEVFSL